MNDSQEEKMNREKAFVEYVFKRKEEDTGYSAKMRRGDNPDTEYYAYEVLAPFVDLQKDEKRLPYALVGAAICREKSKTDGKDGLGEALAKCFGENKDQGNLRMRRLLSCESVQEICLILRQMIRLLQSRAPGNLDYSQLLLDLQKFGYKNPNSIKQKWAMQFYAFSSPDTKATEEEARP